MGASMRLLPSLLALSVVPFALSSLACSAAAPSGEEIAESEDELRTTYGNLFDTLAPADLDRWVDVRQKLVAGFDRICGDTICSGDFSNLATVRLACSSTTAARKMKDCVWVLGGSIDYVDGRTGKLSGESRAFTCHVPVAGNAKAFLDTLSAAGDDALNAPLPGTGKSFYDGLVDCFDGVSGGPPPVSTKTFYAELGEYLWESPDAGASWAATTRKLASSFDDVCGDTFCEGDYPDITALRFACSVNRNTTRVSRCNWTFALADTSVDSRGRVVARTATKVCTVEIGATAAALTSALSGDDPLHATLPGRTTSIYDALVGCL